jgi:hypothetical protein
LHVTVATGFSLNLGNVNAAWDCKLNLKTVVRVLFVGTKVTTSFSAFRIESFISKLHKGGDTKMPKLYRKSNAPLTQRRPSTLVTNVDHLAVSTGRRWRAKSGAKMRHFRITREKKWFFLFCIVTTKNLTFDAMTLIVESFIGFASWSGLLRFLYTCDLEVRFAVNRFYLTAKKVSRLLTWIRVRFQTG